MVYIILFVIVLTAFIAWLFWPTEARKRHDKAIKLARKALEIALDKGEKNKYGVRVFEGRDDSSNHLLVHYVVTQGMDTTTETVAAYYNGISVLQVDMILSHYVNHHIGTYVPSWFNHVLEYVPGDWEELLD